MLYVIQVAYFNSCKYWTMKSPNKHKEYTSKLKMTTMAKKYSNY
jgi:hypothetical protein